VVQNYSFCRTCGPYCRNPSAKENAEYMQVSALHMQLNSIAHCVVKENRTGRRLNSYRRKQLVSHKTASSTAECGQDKPPFSSVRGQDLTMWHIVWVSPQGHRSLSISRHFLLQASQCPCSVQNRFSRHHCCRGISKPGCQIVRSHSRWELTDRADFQLCLRRLVITTGYTSRRNGFLDVSRSNGRLTTSGWIGQLSCLTIFSISLSVAAFLDTAGG